MKNDVALFVAGMFGIVFGGLVSFLWRGSDYGMFLSGVFYAFGVGIVLYWLFNNSKKAVIATQVKQTKVGSVKSKKKTTKKR